MSFIRVITPPGLAVSANDAKAWAPTLGDMEDDQVDILISTAQQALEPPTSWLGRTMMEQTLELVLDAFPAADEIRLPWPPVSAVASVKYDDADGVEQTLDTGLYYAVGLGSLQPRLVLRRGQTWPDTEEGKPEAVRVRFTAGWEEHDPRLLPYKRALVLSVVQASQVASRDLFISREKVDAVGEIEYVVTENAGTVIEKTVCDLLHQYRVWWPYEHR